jgi:hypothetical protein
MKRRLIPLAVLLAVAAPAAAQPPPEPEPVKLTVRPAAAPSPALKYELLPELKDQSPGNAALVYYRAFSPEWWGHIRQPDVQEKVTNALHAPLADLPRQNRGLVDLGWVLDHRMLREVDRGARREYVDWELTEPLRKEGIFMVLPEMQGFRQIGALLALRARLEMAAGHYDKALDTLQTGFALARHIGDGSTLIQDLVGVAIANLMLDQLEDLLQQPGAPNLYWALTALPRPFADLRKALQGEKLWLYGTIPLVRDLDTTPLTPQQQQTLLPAMVGGVDALFGQGQKPAWTDRLAAVGLVLRAYPEAKRALVAEGRRSEDVDALPALQVVLIHSLHQYRRLQDDLYKWYGLPYWEARPQLEQADREIRQARNRLEAIPFIDLLPALDKVTRAAARLDRRIAALRCVEAVRLYAAGHDGKLPAALGAVTDVPIPIDPMTGKAFEYRATGEQATLRGPAPAGQRPSANNAVTYELTLRR